MDAEARFPLRVIDLIESSSRRPRWRSRPGEWYYATCPLAWIGLHRRYPGRRVTDGRLGCAEVEEAGGGFVPELVMSRVGARRCRMSTRIRTRQLDHHQDQQTFPHLLIEYLYPLKQHVSHNP
jgi:hypothetical protein